MMYLHMVGSLAVTYIQPQIPRGTTGKHEPAFNRLFRTAI